MTDLIDIEALSREEVSELIEALVRRQRLYDAEDRVAEEINRFLDTRDGQLPDPTLSSGPITIEAYPLYIAPTGVHNAYVEGRIVRDEDDKLFRARRNGVVHSPQEAPQEWERVYLVDSKITQDPPVDPETGEPEYEDYDPTLTYVKNANNSPLVIVRHDGKLWELIHAAAAPNYVPGEAGMHAVWREYVTE